MGGYISDGHKLVLVLGPDWTIKAKLQCPGRESGCEARWGDGQRPDGKPDCWLAYIVEEFGSEFLEWWCASEGGFTGEIEVTGPIEIEWRYDFGDEPETYWRPLKLR